MKQRGRRREAVTSQTQTNREIFCRSSGSQIRLQSKYPLFFRAARYPESYLCNLVYWGFQCGPGWYPIVEIAAAEIEVELQYLIARIKLSVELRDPEQQEILVDAGLNSKSFYEFYETGNSPLIPFCKEVKESFGQLDIALVNGQLCDAPTWIRIREIVQRAQLKASETCERCGMPGLFRPGYWNRVYCNDCEAGVTELKPIWVAEFL